MKKFGLIVFLLSAVGYAQEFSEKDLKNHDKKVALSKEKGSVELSLDTIFNAGTPYCLFIQTKEVLGNKEFSVQSFDKKEHIYIKTDCVPNPTDPAKKDCFWLFLFMQSGSTGEVNGAFASGLPKIIVENNLITNNTINPDGEKRFLMLYPQKLSKPVAPVMTVNVVYNETAFPMVERDRTADISVYGTTIKQDFKEIGYYTEDSEATGGKVVKTITIYLPGGVKVATATYELASTELFQVYTEKDGKIMHVEVNPAKRMEQLCMFLVQRMYL
ncbi:MAG: hypothetical protein IPM77_14770 [Crocinitomicaceae bacterium]|nr:hypothetical protein [Crocinitomicaceae bacterium]